MGHHAQCHDTLCGFTRYLPYRFAPDVHGMVDNFRSYDIRFPSLVAPRYEAPRISTAPWRQLAMAPAPQPMAMPAARRAGVWWRSGRGGRQLGWHESRDGGGSARPSLFKTAAISGKSDATERTLSTPVVCEVPGVVYGAASVQMGRFWRATDRRGPFGEQLAERTCIERVRRCCRCCRTGVQQQHKI